MVLYISKIKVIRISSATGMILLYTFLNFGRFSASHFCKTIIMERSVLALARIIREIEEIKNIIFSEYS